MDAMSSPTIPGQQVQPGAIAGGSNDPEFKKKSDDNAAPQVVREEGIMPEAYTVGDTPTTVEAVPLKNNTRNLLVAVLACAAIALALGLGLGLTRSNSNSVVPQPEPEEEVEEVLTLQAHVNRTSDFLLSELEVNRYSRIVDGEEEELVTSGFYKAAQCRPVDCFKEGACRGGGSHVYEVGCCSGDNCTASERCSQNCPPGVCRPIEKCRSSVLQNCVECDTGPDGEELYSVEAIEADFDCLNTGYKQTDSGEVYEWAIACGPQTLGPLSWIDTHVCTAFRQGDTLEGHASWWMPCPFLQVAFCGCGPPGFPYSNYGFPTPEKPCTPDDCQFLCDDAGPEVVKDLCYADSGIELWEGINSLNFNLFFGGGGGSPDEEAYLFFTAGGPEIDIYDESRPPAF